MKLTFIGAAHEVTGSCTLIECGGVRGLVDCGMEQGKDIFENQELPVNAGEIDFVLLTHAHIDHSGNLPLLYKNGFRGGIWATEATCNLCNIMLRDCAHIQESEAEFQNRKGRRAGRPQADPVYTMDDALGAIGRLVPCRYGQIVEVAPGVRARMTDVGHLLGSAAIEVFLTEGDETRTVVFSGDVGNSDQPILRDPQPVRAADFLVVESTYGDRLHSAERPDYLASLAGYIQRTLDRGGNVVIPSFAVGRTQEILYFIREIKERGLVHGHPDFPVWVDSPLAAEATAIFQATDVDYLDEEAAAYVRAGINPLKFSGLHISQSVEESRCINMDRTPKVILSASGMCDAGRIRHHLKHNLWDARNLILFVGFQALGTLGRTIHDGAKKVRLFGEDIAVKAEIGVLPGVSGHADRDGLTDWVAQFEKRPVQVFVNHGEDTVTDAFAAHLRSTLGLRADAPYSGAVYNLITEQFEQFPQGRRIRKKTQAHSPAFARLLAALEKLTELVSGCEGRANRDLTKFADQIEALTEKWR